MKPEQFIADLDPGRREEFRSVYDLMEDRVPSDYERVVSRNMIVFQVPLDRYSDTYNRQPLWYAALASDKSYISLHLLPMYGDPVVRARIEDAFTSAGRKLNAGKGCIRFKKATELELNVIGDVLASFPMERWIDVAKRWRR